MVISVTYMNWNRTGTAEKQSTGHIGFIHSSKLVYIQRNSQINAFNLKGLDTYMIEDDTDDTPR